MPNENQSEQSRAQQLTPYLSPLGVWALAFGCAVGWGAFVMPGTTFLPAAGPLGTALGIGLGAVVMLIIGMNYHYLLQRYPDAGGTLSYTAKTFGYDHGFLSAWFLALVYVAITWANATALALISKNLLGSMFQFGFHYQVLGYDVYLGEALLSITAIVLFGFLCIRSKRLAGLVHTVMALVLLCGILVSFFAVMGKHQTLGSSFAPAFAPDGTLPAVQILQIVVLAPWAYVGFESVSHSAEEFRFDRKKAIWPIVAALVTSALAYTLLALMAAAVLPEGFGDWTQYIGALGTLEGLEGLPTFFAAHEAMGQAGLWALGITVLAAIITGLVGNAIAASRLLYAMAREGILPAWFGELTEDGSPKNALFFLSAVSVWIPFFGRTAIGWIVDVNTIGATIAYAYTSAAAFATAKREGNRRMRWSGLVGVVLSVWFFFYFMSMSSNALSTESYLILALWSILGFIFFRQVFSRDKARRFGKSTVVWVGLLFLIFFTSLMWVNQATDDMTREVVSDISRYYEQRSPDHDPSVLVDTERYLKEQMDKANRHLIRNSAVQMALIVVSLAIMLNVYSIMSRREVQMEEEKAQAELERAKAEESSKAKSVFLSNMSHDIRTPMNAIIGYTNLAERDENDPAQVREYLSKIKSSSQHLLALINDVLEMSRIESGKMDLEPIPVDLCRTMDEVKDMFATQMREKDIDFGVNTSHVKRRWVLCDKSRLNRVLLNLLSNAYKFTPEGGSITVTLWQIEGGSEEYGNYELRVKDSGIGMTPEFAARVFEAFERERTSTVSGIQGTGLGMAITKSIVDLMGGTIELVTAPGEGTEFIIRLRFALQGGEETRPESGEDRQEMQEEALDFSKMCLLLVEDNEINREIATLILEEAGFTLETAENGQIAADKLAHAEAGRYDAVLMDIQMPVMNGYEAARAIRALPQPELAQIPIIAMTANAFSEDVKAALDAGMNAHVAKPIDVTKLMETLTAVLREGHTHESL